MAPTVFYSLVYSFQKQSQLRIHRLATVSLRSSNGVNRSYGCGISRQVEELGIEHVWITVKEIATLCVMLQTYQYHVTGAKAVLGPLTLSTRCWSGWYNVSPSKRLAGIGVQHSRPSHISSQSLLGLFIPPANLQLMPIMATGSRMEPLVPA